MKKHIKLFSIILVAAIMTAALAGFKSGVEA